VVGEGCEVAGEADWLGPNGWAVTMGVNFDRELCERRETEKRMDCGGDIDWRRPWL
jgi:hypothetical protein